MQTATQSDTSAPALFSSANFINGRWVQDGDGTVNSVVDKYHGTELARLPHATSVQMEEAIAASAASSVQLRRMSAGQRSAALDALAHDRVDRGMPAGNCHAWRQ